jgi:hypothetical protein
MNYNNRTFRAVSNAENGEVTSDTLFYYQQETNVVVAIYEGGRIAQGHLMGLVAPDGSLDFHYHHINTDGQLMAGHCHSTPEVMPNGKLRLHERWQWTTGDGSSGTSVVEEV